MRSAAAKARSVEHLGTKYGKGCSNVCVGDDGSCFQNVTAVMEAIIIII